MGHRAPRAAATLGRLVALVAALALLGAMPSAASAAGTITDFSVKRTQSLPSDVLNQLANPVVLPGFVSGNPALAPLLPALGQLNAVTKFYVASPLGFPAGPSSALLPKMLRTLWPTRQREAGNTARWGGTG